MPLPDSYGQPNTVNGVTSDSDTSFAAANMINQNISGGQLITLPPKQFGEQRIQAPSGFKVIGTPMYSALGAVFTLVWQDLINTYNLQIAGYRLYAQQFLNDNQEPTLVGTSATSPCTVRVVATQAGTITFWLQPFAVSGASLPLSACPTCTSTVPNPYFSFTITDPTTGVVTTAEISNMVQFASTTRQGFEVYEPVTGISGPHSTMVFDGIETASTTATARMQPTVVQVLEGTTAVGILTNVASFPGPGNNGLIVLNSDTTANVEASLDGGLGILKLVTATGNEVDYTSTTGPTALGAYQGFIEVIVNGNPFKLPYYA